MRPTPRASARGVIRSVQLVSSYNRSMLHEFLEESNYDVSTETRDNQNVITDMPAAMSPKPRAAFQYRRAAKILAHNMDGLRDDIAEELELPRGANNKDPNTPEEQRIRALTSLSCTQDNQHDDRPGIAVSAMYEHMWHVLFRRHSGGVAAATSSAPTSSAHDANSTAIARMSERAHAAGSYLPHRSQDPQLPFFLRVEGAGHQGLGNKQVFRSMSNMQVESHGGSHTMVATTGDGGEHVAKSEVGEDGGRFSFSFAGDQPFSADLGLRVMALLMD